MRWFSIWILKIPKCRAVPFVEREEEYHEMSAFTLGHCGTVGILAGCVNQGGDCAAMFLKKKEKEKEKAKI